MEKRRANGGENRMNALKDFSNMNPGKQRDAILDYAQKLDGTVGEKVRSVKGWLFKLLGGFLLFIGVVVLLFGAVNAGTGIVGGGVVVLGSGLRRISAKGRHVMLGLGVAVVGTAFLNYGIGQMSQAKKSVDWPSAPGTVTKSEKEKRTTTEGTGSDKKTITYYAAVINYEYKVDGKTHNSNRIAFGGQNRNRSAELLNKYPKGKSVDVFYDPDNPREAVLEKGFNQWCYFFPGFGAFIVILGLLVAFKTKKQSSNA